MVFADDDPFLPATPRGPDSDPRAVVAAVCVAVFVAAAIAVVTALR